MIMRVMTAAVALLLLSISASAETGEPPATMEVIVPDYVVESRGDHDYVDIPDGEVLFAEEGRPRVPYYSKTVTFSSSYRIHDVLLSEEPVASGVTGLILPVISDGTSPEEEATEEGWYPERLFTWRSWENGDETSTLLIIVYPFRYNPQTAEALFHKLFRFEIECFTVEVDVVELHTDKAVYEHGDRAHLDVHLRNSGRQQTIFVSVIVGCYGTGEIVLGLPLRALEGLSGSGSYSVDWELGNTEPGLYYALLTLSDGSGVTLDEATAEFAVQYAPENGKSGQQTSAPFVCFADSAEKPGAIHMIDDASSTEAVVYTRSASNLDSFCFRHSPDELYLVDASDRRIVKCVREEADWGPEEVVYAHSTYIRDIAFATTTTGETKLLFSEASGAGADGRILVLDQGNASPYYEVGLKDIGGSWSGHFALDSEGTLYLSTGYRTPASIYKVVEGSLVRAYTSQREPIAGLFVSDGVLYFASGRSGVSSLDLATGEIAVLYENPEHARISDVALLAQDLQ